MESRADKYKNGKSPREQLRSMMPSWKANVARLKKEFNYKVKDASRIDTRIDL